MQIHLPASAEQSSDPIADLLLQSKNIAVVGLSPNPMRPSFGVASYLQSVGYTIIPVNPNASVVLGQKSYPRLEDVPVPIDIVDVFRLPQFIPPIAESAIALHARCLWLQQGIAHEAAAQKAAAAGLLVVEDACLLIEHKKRRR